MRPNPSDLRGKKNFSDRTQGISNRLFKINEKVSIKCQKLKEWKNWKEKKL